MVTTSVAKPTTKCTESENESQEETGSAGTTQENDNREENNPSFELADNTKVKELMID